jgi:lactate dehydrogenase-like 2-hydroxyacid dehydrogenase
VRAVVTLGGLRNDAGMLGALPALGLLHCYGTGHEGVDAAYCAGRGIAVTHAGDANATSVAEFALGLILATHRQILVGDAFVRAGKWADQRLERMPLVGGLSGAKLGIYGLGAIGERLAQRAAACEMVIGYHNRRPRPGCAHAYFESLGALAEWADVLAVCVRAGPANRGAVDAHVLRALGPRGVVVNIARGSVIDEPALIAALQAQEIAGAGLDVFVAEPEVPAALRAMPNVVLTPHMAAHTISAQRAQQRALLETLEAFFAGQPLTRRISG